MAGFSKIAKQAYIDTYGAENWKNGNEDYQVSNRKKKGWWSSAEGKRTLYFSHFGVKYFGLTRTADFFNLTNYQLGAQLAGYVYRRKIEYFNNKYPHLVATPDADAVKEVNRLVKPKVSKEPIKYNNTEVTEADKAKLILLLHRRINGTDKTARKLNKLAAKYHLRYCIGLKELVHTDLFYLYDDGRYSSISILGEQQRSQYREQHGQANDGMAGFANEELVEAQHNRETKYGHDRLINDDVLAEINKAATGDRIKNHTELQKAYEDYYNVSRDWDNPLREELKNKIKEVDPVSIIIFNTSKKGVTLSKIINRMASQYKSITKDDIIQLANEYFGTTNAMNMKQVDKYQVKQFRYYVWNQFPETFEITFEPIELLPGS